MSKYKYAAIIALLASIAFASSQAFTRAQEDGGEKEKPKYTIKEVMKIANKDKLVSKVAKGDATEEEKKLLLDAFLALGENEPPMGDADSWLKHTSKAVAGAARVVVGREGAEKQLKKAFACASCHKAHKPKTEE